MDMKKLFVVVMLLFLSVPALALTLGTSTQGVLPYGTDIAWVAEVWEGGELIASFAAGKEGIVVPKGATIKLLRSASGFFEKKDKEIRLSTRVICLLDNQRLEPKEGREDQAFAWYLIEANREGSHGVCFLQVDKEDKPQRKPSTNFVFLVLPKEAYLRLYRGESPPPVSTAPLTKQPDSPSLEGERETQALEEEKMARLIIGKESNLPSELSVSLRHETAGEVEAETVDGKAVFEMPPGKVTLKVKEVPGWQLSYPKELNLDLKGAEVLVRARPLFATLVVENRSSNPCKIQLTQGGRLLKEIDGTPCLREIAASGSYSFRVPAGLLRLELAPGWIKYPGLTWVVEGSPERLLKEGSRESIVVDQVRR
jgi:hypothetical protein